MSQAPLKNMFEIISDTDENARRNILFYFVASLNSSVIFNLLASARRKGRTNRDDVTDLDRRNTADSATAEADYEQLMRNEQGMDQDDNLATAKQLHRVRNFFLDELVALSLRPVEMSYRDSLDRQLKRPPAARNSDEQLQSIVDLIDIPDVVTVQSVRAAQVANSAKSVHELQHYREQILAATDCFDYDPAGESDIVAAFDEMPPAKQYMLVQTLWRATVRAIGQLARNFNFDTLADLTILKLVKIDCERLMQEYRNERFRDAA
ncbi:MAG: hypothetical protein ACXWCQ_30845 [Burkholderiales bacterium]